jgi:ubiquinone/menaquinone biosynthesis C-methylase UbiE
LGLYGRYVVPFLINASMSSKKVTEQRTELVPRARGRVLEVGIGSGLNLPFYGPEVAELDGVDPSPELLRQARRRATAARFPVRLHAESAERLPFPDGIFDTAVMTWTLCSIPEPETAGLPSQPSRGGSAAWSPSGGASPAVATSRAGSTS